MTRLPPALLLAALLGGCATREGLPPEPVEERHLSEDDQVRIAELKVRGQAQQITVQNKSGQLKGSQYEIVPVTPARDPSQPGQGGGQRVWSFSF